MVYDGTITNGTVVLDNGAKIPDGTRVKVVVPADHFHVHHHPTAVTEVKRILFDHLREGQVIQPVSAGTR